MHTLAKFLFFLASAVTVVVIGAFLFVGLVGDGEKATFALGWLSTVAIAVWLSVAGILVLLMATTTKAGQGKLIGMRSVYEWGILALLLLLAAHLINSSYSSVWSGVTDRWYSSPVWSMLTLLAGLSALVAGVALLPSVAARLKSSLTKPLRTLGSLSTLPKGYYLSYPFGNRWGYQYEPWHWCFRDAQPIIPPGLAQKAAQGR